MKPIRIMQAHASVEFFGNTALPAPVKKRYRYDTRTDRPATIAIRIIGHIGAERMAEHSEYPEPSFLCLNEACKIRHLPEGIIHRSDPGTEIRKSPRCLVISRFSGGSMIESIQIIIIAPTGMHRYMKGRSQPMLDWLVMPWATIMMISAMGPATNAETYTSAMISIVLSTRSSSRRACSWKNAVFDER